MDFWEQQPECENCDYKLCYLDRQFDQCPMCEHEIPVAVRV